MHRLLRSLYIFERSEVEHFGLTFQQIYLLKYLRRRSTASFTAVAAEMRMPPFGVTRLLDRLVRDRLVTRTAEKHDRRQRVIAITRKGIDLAVRIEDQALSMVLGNLARFTPVEVNAIIRVVTDLDSILGIDAGENSGRTS